MPHALHTTESGTKPRVLVVDDERFNRNVLADLLKPDYTVVLAKSGEQALQKVHSDLPPNLILLDIMMPEMDGYEVCRRLKADPATADIPIIFVTSMTDADDEMKGLAIGAIDFIGKPFSPAIVQARVRNHLALAQAHAKVTEARERLTALLDNSGQGFLSFGKDLTLDSTYSHQCCLIFSQNELAGQNIATLLHPQDARSARRMASNLQRIMNEADDYIQDLYFSLMPKELALRVPGAEGQDRHYQIQYKMLDHERMMLILTDVTTQRNLEDAVSNERNRLAFIVAAFTDSRLFQEIVESYKTFRVDKLPRLLEQEAAAQEDVSDLYRFLHTFKGLFSQFNFIYMPDVLHEKETQVFTVLNTPGLHSPGALQSVFAGQEDLAALERDTNIITQALGEDFFYRRAAIFMSSEQADNLEQLALRLLHDKDLQPTSEVKTLISEIRRLRMEDMKHLLRTYPTAVLKLAQRYEKDIAPFQVTGGTVMVNPEPYTSFLQSLVHVFRNAVDHGIETPDEREEAGKPPIGEVRCDVRLSGGTIFIEIRDDGRGIDVDALRQVIVDKGIITENAASALSDDAVLAYIFHDQFTTKEVSEISGRGVGLAAVKAEVEALHGDVKLRTTPGEGTTFQFALPLHTAP